MIELLIHYKYNNATIIYSRKLHWYQNNYGASYLCSTASVCYQTLKTLNYDF